MKKLLIICSGIVFITTVAASPPGYDQTLITTQSWEEVDLTYTSLIKGKKYTEQASLLRPIAWIKHNHLDQVGAIIHLTAEQLGFEAVVKVVALKSGTLNYGNNNHENTRPVIGIFTTHSNDIGNYVFKDQSGTQVMLTAASDQPFYSLDRHAYIPIGQLQVGEQVKSRSNSKIFLVSNRQNSGVKTIHNVEVYQQHNYMVGNNGILVHNPLTCWCGQECFNKSTLKRHELTHTGERLFPCEYPGCEKSFKRKTHRVSHMLTHTGVRAFICDDCGKDFPRKDTLGRHKNGVHASQKAYACPYCTYKINRIDHLKSHIQRTHKLDGAPPTATMHEAELPGTSAMTVDAPDFAASSVAAPVTILPENIPSQRVPTPQLWENLLDLEEELNAARHLQYEGGAPYNP